jgi:hypothetical protein
LEPRRSPVLGSSIKKKSQGGPLPSLKKPAVVLALVLVTGLGLLLADSGPAHQVKQTPPVKLGTSGGNINNESKRFCCSGTLGSLVTKGGLNYILSNNHILADSDTATVGDPISQPGLIDVNCNATQAQIVANFSQAVKLGTGNVDAAIARVVNGEVDSSGAILDVGVPASTPATINNTAIGRGVAKSGRTTGLTCATINAINTNVKVQYQTSCNAGKKFTVTYTNQVLINGSTFSGGGDSGSLIVTSDTAQPIALLFAGSSSDTIGNRISDVTSALGVSFVGGNTHSVSCPASSQAALVKQHGHPSEPVHARAHQAKEKHAARLMSDPAVLAVGEGASETDPSEAVVVVYVEKGKKHGAIPAQLDGVRTRVVDTDAFRAFGWNESQPIACAVK